MLCPLSEYVHYLVIKYCYYAPLAAYFNLPACIISLYLISAIAANVIQICLICGLYIRGTAIYVLCSHILKYCLSLKTCITQVCKEQVGS